MSSPESPVIVHVDGGVGTLTLNRPAALNALDHEMVGIIARALADWSDDPAVRTVVLVGAGERGLCAGGDIVAIHRDATAVTGGDDAAAAATGSAAFWRDEYRLNARIAAYPKPYVAIMDGIVMGGGVGLSAHAGHRVVTDRTRLAMPETGIGLVPDVGGTWLLAHAPANLGVYAALTGVHLDGADAIALGLADHYVRAARLDDLRAALATVPADQALAAFAEQPPASAVAAERAWIDAAFAAGTVPEIIAACRAAGDPAAHTAADTVERKSPTMTVATLAALAAARTEPSLRDALRREYRTSLRCLCHPDLAEGIRAQVIDKDRNPHWQRGSIAAVTADEVAAFTAPLPGDLELTYAEESESTHA